MTDNFGQSSSQDILMKLDETPAAVQNSDIYKDRLRHLSFSERSERLVMKNIKETVAELRKTPEGRKQSKLFIAGVSHPVYGDPCLDLEDRTRKEVKQIKEDLLKGKESTLKAKEGKKRETFPPRVVEIGSNHWYEHLIPEPAKQTGKVVEDEGEIRPTQYQDKTDKEMFANFQDECTEEVKVEMTKQSEEMLLNLSKRPDSQDKQRRLEYARNLPDRLV